jgi:hypothetical protein
METESVSKSLVYFSQMTRRWSRESFTELICRDILKIYTKSQDLPPLFIANIPLKYIFIYPHFFWVFRGHILQQATPLTLCKHTTYCLLTCRQLLGSLWRHKLGQYLYHKSFIPRSIWRHTCIRSSAATHTTEVHFYLLYFRVSVKSS